jgi:uncharacterized protein
MSHDYMHYDKMVQSALRGVMRDALKRTATQGLVGEHHFYIAFRTDHPDVDISDMLKSRYPSEMTIILQNQYWGLEVHEDYFEVGLSFNKMPERLHIPFAAVRQFVDPSVKFGLEFEVELPDQPAETEPVTLMPKPAETEARRPGEEPGGAPATAAVVSLDSFRKK